MRYMVFVSMPDGEIPFVDWRELISAQIHDRYQLNTIAELTTHPSHANLQRQT